MSKFVNPPRDVQDALLEALKRRYPDLEERKDVFRSISYSSGGSPKTIYGATVNYYHGKGSSIALFDYQENSSTQTYYWYCRKDWKD